MKTYLEKLLHLPTSILADVMNRMNCMEAAIKPLQEGVSMAGPAVTVKSMVGGNWGSHKALSLLKPGEVLVVDARKHEDTAVWGFLQSYAAMKKRAAGVVIDGAVRDVREISQSSLPVYCRSVTPAGPHKGWRDEVNVPVQCGGVVVQPGDYIRGDSDGIVVIAGEKVAEIIELALKRLAKEKTWFEKVDQGLDTFTILGLMDE